jgi:hypothetical protein
MENEHLMLYVMSFATKTAICMAYVITEPPSIFYSSREACAMKLVVSYSH